MPKMKTNSGAKKRFIARGNGSLKKRNANRNHILTKKAHKRKVNLRGTCAVDSSDMDNALRMLCMK